MCPRLFALVSCLILPAALDAQNGRIQKPGEIQKPRGTWQVPGPIQKPGPIQTVKEQCTARLLASADTLFEFDKSDLSDGAEKVLAELGPMIRKEGRHPLTIDGHTDALGTAAYNQTLSEKRAKAVEVWLRSHGFVEGDAARVRGLGHTHPVAPNTKPDGTDNPEGRQKNRRVEIVIDTCH